MRLKASQREIGEMLQKVLPAKESSCWLGRMSCLRRDAYLEIAVMPFFYRLWLRTGSSQGVLSTPTDLSDVPESV